MSAYVRKIDINLYNYPCYMCTFSYMYLHNKMQCWKTLKTFYKFYIITCFLRLEGEQHFLLITCSWGLQINHFFPIHDRICLLFSVCVHFVYCKYNWLLIFDTCYLYFSLWDAMCTCIFHKHQFFTLIDTTTLIIYNLLFYK